MCVFFAQEPFSAPKTKHESSKGVAKTYIGFSEKEGAKNDKKGRFNAKKMTISAQKDTN